MSQRVNKPNSALTEAPSQPVWGSLGLKRFFEKYFEDPDLQKKFKKIFYPFLGLLVVLDLLIHKEHATFLWDSIPGFWSIYGFIATVVMIIVSKAIGHAWLMKSEDYYD